MASFIPSIPYGPPLTDGGYWAPITSTLDWCEENYYLSPYVAEIINTFTNLLFVWLAFKGIRNCIKEGHDTIFLITFLGYLVVGTGSAAFHCTLKYPMQLVDELSMIYTTCLMFWATFSHSRPRGTQITLGVFTAALSIFITLYYHYLQDPTFHQNAYAVLTALVLFRSMYVMEMHLRPHFRNKRRLSKPSEQGNGHALNGYAHGNGHARSGKVSGSPERVNEASAEELARQDVRDTVIVQRMWLMVGVGLSVFLGGFAIWNLDNAHCSRLRGWRRDVGLPWGVILEGHGWWHLMTGYGAYMYIQWGIWLRHCLNGRQDEFELHWPRLLSSIPVVIRRRSTTKTNDHIRAGDTHAKTHGHAIGHAHRHINGNSNGEINGYANGYTNANSAMKN